MRIFIDPSAINSYLKDRELNVETIFEAISHLYGCYYCRVFLDMVEGDAAQQVTEYLKQDSDKFIEAALIQSLTVYDDKAQYRIMIHENYTDEPEHHSCYTVQILSI